MTLRFLIKYATSFGESVWIKIGPQGYALQWADGVHWQGDFEQQNLLSHRIRYEIILKGSAGEQVLGSGKINLKKFKGETVSIVHDDLYVASYRDIFRTKPFKRIFRPRKQKSFLKKRVKKPTHIFIAILPLLKEGISLCLTGSVKKTGSFDPGKTLFFSRKQNGEYHLKIDLSKEQFPVEYKLAMYEHTKKTIIEYEPGSNRILDIAPAGDHLTIIHTAPDLQKYAWRGAGINIPVFSLRSEKSWGGGEFTDLHLLADHAAAAGLKLIQLLPVNDTTAEFTNKDSYPYSAISAFALHPKYLNIEKIAAHAGVEITDEERAQIKRLNEFSFSDHSGVVKLKLAVLKRLFAKERYYFRDDTDWFSFFDMNREWLQPYAAFCTLRDKYGTADHAKWNEYAVYRQEKIQELTSPGSRHYDEILFWYYTQYHLHLQLKDAVDYAHKKGIILKADLPIGVGRFSADTWQHPELFNMDMQAGAPPDAFSDQGQNWGFPTYNMERMKAGNFSWFRKRMEHLENYFDAVRIDHVLGFFRIWSIPIGQTEGTMGRFVPAIALSENELTAAGINFDEERLCDPFTGGKTDDVILLKDAGGYHFRINMQHTDSFAHLPEEQKTALNNLYRYYFYERQNVLWEKEGREKLAMLKASTNMMLCAEDLGMVPDFTDEVLHSLKMLSLQVLQMPKKDCEPFSDTAHADYASVVMPATHDMSPMRLWWEQHRENAPVLFNDILKERGAAPYFCEPWICEKIFRLHLASPAMWSIFLLPDILSVNGKIRRPHPGEERINDPADKDQVWNYRMHITLEELLRQNDFNDTIKKAVKESGR